MTEWRKGSAASLKKRERARLLDWLKDFTHTVTGH